MKTQMKLLISDVNTNTNLGGGSGLRPISVEAYGSIMPSIGRLESTLSALKLITSNKTYGNKIPVVLLLCLNVNFFCNTISIQYQLESALINELTPSMIPNCFFQHGAASQTS